MTRSLHLRHGMAVVVAWFAWLGGSGMASAQEQPKLPPAAPTLAAMVPAGVAQGATIEVTVQGSNLAAVTSLRLSGAGVSAELVPPPANARPNNQQFLIKLAAAADAEPGMRELRVVTESGVSNILRFVVGSLPEATEAEPNDTSGSAMKLGSLPLVVNGAINRGEDRDHFRFFAKAGQQLVLDLWAERLHPYVSNQRPGWFEGLLTVREAGKLGEVADLLLVAEKSAAEKAGAAKEATAAVNPAQGAARKANEQRSVAERAKQTAVASATKAKGEHAAALSAHDKLVAELATAEKDATAAKAQVDEFVAQQAAVANAATDDAEKAKQRAENAKLAQQAAEKRVRDLNVARKTAADQLATKRAAADRAAAEETKAEAIAAEKIAVAEKANATLMAAQATVKTRADELAAATALVAQHKEVVTKIANEPSRNLAYSHDLAGREDPLLIFTAPKDGEYIVEVRDELYRGRPEYNYRLTIGELPYVTAVFPAGGQRGTTVPVTLVGIGLAESAKQEVPLPAVATNGTRRAARATNTLGVTNDFQLEIGEDPEVTEAEPNEVAAQGAVVAIPTVINGTLDRDGDVDVFQFLAKKGDRVLCEVTARVLGSPLDARLELIDANGRRLKENDDNNNLADSLIDHTFTADGQYAIRVMDATDTGSPRHVYRLKLRAPRPDFSLLVSPDNPRVAAGGTVSLKVLARRRDGFDGAIELSVPNPPPGVTVSPAVIAGPLSEQMLTVSVAADAASAVLPLAVVGKAKRGEEELVRNAVPAEPMRYVNDWRYVPVNDLVLSVIPPAPFTLAWSATDTKVEAGQTTQVTLKVTRADGFRAPIRILLEGLPPRVSSPPVTLEENATEVVVELRTANGAAAAASNVVASGTATADGRTFVQVTPAMRMQLDAAPKK